MIDKSDFDFLRDLIKEKSGISLSDDKSYLIDSRLVPVARSLDLDGIQALVAKVKATKDSSIITSIIEAMTTNETSFYRDLRPFQIFSNDVLPHVIANKAGNLDIWCAACSTGQEPYSLAMTIAEEKAKLSGMNVAMKATDIDNDIINKAKEAIYSQFEVQRGLPITHLMKYFTQLQSYGEKWELKSEVKDMVKFSQLNLLDSYTSMGKFDIIFCRNVLIYFEPEMKSAILDKLAGCLKPHGVLFLGSSETINGLTEKLDIFQDIRGVFCLK